MSHLFLDEPLGSGLAKFPHHMAASVPLPSASWTKERRIALICVNFQTDPLPGLSRGSSAGVILRNVPDRHDGVPTL